MLSSIWKFAVLFTILTNSSMSYFLPTIPRQVPVSPKCCYFTGAGIYFFWQLGCAQYLKENCKFDDLPIVGASAGSLTATLLLSRADLKLSVTKALELNEAAETSKRGSLAGIWGAILKDWLQDVIPEDIEMKDLEKLQIAVTPANVAKSPKLVSNFKDKKDLIDACLASCHVPVFLDGRPFTEYRGEQVLDGSFWYFVTKDRNSGLPLPSGIGPEDVYWVDYGDDEEFMQSISGNFLELVSPDKVPEMIEAGYNFMKREHYQGRLPLAVSDKPNFVGRLLLGRFITGFAESLPSLAERIPIVIGDMANSMPRRFEAATTAVATAAAPSLKWMTPAAGALVAVPVLTSGAVSVGSM